MFSLYCGPPCLTYGFPLGRVSKAPTMIDKNEICLWKMQLGDAILREAPG